MGSGQPNNPYIQNQCEVEPVKEEQSPQHEDLNFMNDIHQSNKENMEKRRSSIGTEKKERYMRKSIKDRETLKENLPAIRK